MYNVFALPAPDIMQEPLLVGQRLTVTFPEKGAVAEVDDQLLVLDTKKQEVLPYLFSIDGVNRSAHTLILKTNIVYTIPVPANAGLRHAVAKETSSGSLEESFAFIHLSRTVFQNLISGMGGIRPEEREVLAQIESYIAARGYYFDQETLYNYHISLKTRPFVILAGLSGTGKSKLAQLYAEALGLAREHHRRVAVRPSWNDDRYLLGYLNTLTGEYMTEPALDFMLRAAQDEENLYFFCLDEMNLAHVEYYFSQFLSALEEDDPQERTIPLLSEGVQRRLQAQSKTLDVPGVLSIPTNLLFTGTINVDETTQPLSDKVLDRANTLEFFSVDLAKIPERRPLPELTKISALTWRSYQARRAEESYRAQIIEIGAILNRADMGLGYRVLREIERYLANSKGLLSLDVAFDLQVKQRILPRVRGTEAIRGTLDDLLLFMQRNTLPRSAQRLTEMKARLQRDGYTNFWR